GNRLIPILTLHPAGGDGALPDEQGLRQHPGVQVPQDLYQVRAQVLRVLRVLRAPAPAGAHHKRVLQVPVTRGQVPDVPVQPGLAYANQPGDPVAVVVGDPLVALRAVTAGAVGGNLLWGGQEGNDLLPDGGLDHIGDPPGGGRVQQVGVDLRPAGQPGESVDVGDGERDHGPSLWFLAPAFL